MSRYPITFDMDTNWLKEHYHNNSHISAYADIKNVLAKQNFEIDDLTMPLKLNGWFFL